MYLGGCYLYNINIYIKEMFSLISTIKSDLLKKNVAQRYTINQVLTWWFKFFMVKKYFIVIFFQAFANFMIVVSFCQFYG